MMNKCQLTTLIAIALQVSLLVNYSNCGYDNNNISRYAIPDAKVEVFSKGFRVSIPDDEGIKLFAFHAKINQPIYDVEPGTYSKEILRKKNGRWTFEDTETKLKLGDVIYYWMFVERFNLGYRIHGEHTVEKIESSSGSPTKPETTCKPCRHEAGPTSHKISDEKDKWYFETLNLKLNFNRKQAPTPLDSRIFFEDDISLPPATIKPAESVTLSPTSPTVNANAIQTTIIGSRLSTPDPVLSSCCKLFLNVSNELASLSDELDLLKEENKILTELAKKDDFYARTVTVFGKYPEEYYDTPKDFAQNLVSEKLRLPKITVMEAKKLPDNGVRFKVEKLQDKVQIVLASREKLNGSNYEVVW